MRAAHDAAHGRVAARHAARGRHRARAPGAAARSTSRVASSEVEATFADMGLDALIVVGGNGSLSVACRLHSDFGLPIVGVPKTIDNDIVGTDMTFGFNTAVQIATDAIDRLHTTAESHDRVMVVEVMGRHSGWIATHAGIAGGAAVVLIPELPFDIDEVCDRILRRHERGRYASIVVVAEGADARRTGSLDIGDRRCRPVRPRAPRRHRQHRVADEIGRRTGFETRSGAARPRPAGRHADGVRPRAVDTVRRGRRSTPCTTGRGARWSCSAATRSTRAPLTEAVGRTRRRRPRAVPRRRRDLLRLSRRQLRIDGTDGVGAVGPTATRPG